VPEKTIVDRQVCCQAKMVEGGSQCGRFGLDERLQTGFRVQVEDYVVPKERKCFIVDLSAAEQWQDDIIQRQSGGRIGKS
jgi:hypothetical protein